MSKADLIEYINQPSQSMVTDDINWEQERDKWISSLNDLYEQVRSFLSDSQLSGKVKIEEPRKKTIEEEFIGQYVVDQLIIKINNETVVLDPVGTNLIGTKGRVDMIGYAETVRFVLANKDLDSPKIKVTIRTEFESNTKPMDDDEQIEWVWKIATPPPYIQFIPLNEDSFSDALMKVLNG